MNQIKLTPELRLSFDDPKNETTDHNVYASNFDFLRHLSDSSRGEPSPSHKFWLGFWERFMRRLAVTFHGAESEALALALSDDDIGEICRAAPAMNGCEYLDADACRAIWVDLEESWKALVAKSQTAPTELFKREFPQWQDVGKIHFHFAENKKDPNKPFALLVTYACRVNDQARMQHRPLGLALKDALSTGNRQDLELLIRPIQTAAKTSPILRAALADRTIYGPIFLDAERSLQYLKDISKFDQAGIICKVPDFWRGKKPPKVQINFKFKLKQGDNPLGVASLVSFDMEMALGDQTLTPEQIEQIFKAKSPLVNLTGHWVRVDGEKLQAILNEIKGAKGFSDKSGFSLGQALRMIHRFRLQNSDNAIEDVRLSLENDGDDDDDTTVEFKASEELQRQLAQLQSPDTLVFESWFEQTISQRLNATLRPYQLSGVKWLWALKNLGMGGCLADDMGLGKTIQVISLLLLMKERAITTGMLPPKSLLVVPASLMGNWSQELKRFAPSINFQVDHPSYFASQFCDQSCDLVITTYGMMLRRADLQSHSWDALFCDEAQALKNSGSKQSKMIRGVPSKVKFALTGTPIENHLGDLWTIFDFCCRGLLGTQTAFRKAVSTMEEGESPDYTPLRNLINPFILRRKKSDKKIISDLPDKIELTQPCNLSPKQITQYTEQVALLQAALLATDGVKRKGVVLGSLMKMKQICNHPALAAHGNKYVPEDSGKFEHLREICETIASRQERVLVFTQFKEITDVLEHFLAGVFGRNGLIIHGGTPPEARSEMVAQFQQPDGPAFFVLSLKAGGTGLNLTRAQHVIHFDRWWNPAVENQATDRAYRIGQKNNVMVHKFLCRGTLEEKIDALIATKKSLSDAVVERGAEDAITELSNDQILDLVRLDLEGTSP